MIEVSTSSLQGPRPNNEDAVFHANGHTGLPGGEQVWITVTADGVGGMDNGQYMSAWLAAAVVGFLLHLVHQIQMSRDDQAVHGLMEQAVHQAHRSVVDAADAEDLAMATTVVVMLIIGGRVHYGWIGDSRLYRWRDGQIERLSRDHNYAQELVDAGAMPAEMAERSPFAHQLTRCLRTDDSAPPLDTATCPLAPGDVVLACTDGLTGPLGDLQLAEAIGAFLEGDQPFDAIAEHLTQMAIDLGATDNTTAHLCRYRPDIEQASTAATRTDHYVPMLTSL